LKPAKADPAQISIREHVVPAFHTEYLSWIGIAPPGNAAAQFSVLERRPSRHWLPRD
jgi:hypothetical protein